MALTTIASLCGVQVRGGAVFGRLRNDGKAQIEFRTGRHGCPPVGDLPIEIHACICAHRSSMTTLWNIFKAGDSFDSMQA